MLRKGFENLNQVSDPAIKYMYLVNCTEMSLEPMNGLLTCWRTSRLVKHIQPAQHPGAVFIITLQCFGPPVN